MWAGVEVMRVDISCHAPFALGRCRRTVPTLPTGRQRRHLHHVETHADPLVAPPTTQLARARVRSGPNRRELGLSERWRSRKRSALDEERIAPDSRTTDSRSPEGGQPRGCCNNQARSGRVRLAKVCRLTRCYPDGLDLPGPRDEMVVEFSGPLSRARLILTPATDIPSLRRETRTSDSASSMLPRSTPCALPTPQRVPDAFDDGGGTGNVWGANNFLDDPRI
jgi:hypothetical protein